MGPMLARDVMSSPVIILRPDVPVHAAAALLQVMTPSPTTMPPDADLADVVARMLHDGIRSVPTVEDGRMVGVVSGRDALRVVAHRELTSEDVC
jgi:CBS domain-containing protein